MVSRSFAICIVLSILTQFPLLSPAKSIDYVNFEDNSSSDYFYGNLSEYGPDNTYHYGNGEWSLRLRDVDCEHASKSYAYVEGGSGEVQFMFKPFPWCSSCILNFSLEDNQTMTLVPGSGWTSSGLIPININSPSGHPYRISWEYRQKGPCISTTPSSIWIDDIGFTRNLSLSRHEGQRTCEFRNESYSPSTGTVLSEYCFEINIDRPISQSSSSRVVLLIENLNDEIEVERIKEVSNFENKIKFDNISFASPGEKRYRFIIGDCISNEFVGPTISPLIINIKPLEGCNMEPFNFSISRLINKDDEEFDIFIQLKYSNNPDWIYSRIGKWDRNNITFNVSDLNFDEPCLGYLEYRISTPNGIKGPFQGPYIFANYRNVQIDRNQDTISTEMRSDRCGERICLTIDNRTYRSKIYNNCSEWEYFEWNGINLDNAEVGSIKNCD